MEHLDPVTVYTLTDANVAELIKIALKAEGIPCLMAGLEQAHTAGLPGTQILVQVPGDVAVKARKIIEGLEHHKKAHNHPEFPKSPE